MNGLRGLIRKGEKQGHCCEKQVKNFAEENNSLRSETSITANSIEEKSKK